MAKLIYVTNASLDGFTEDRHGGIDWGAPDQEYFGAINEIERSVGTYLYGRRMYETMVYWERAPDADQPSWTAEFARMWRTAHKVVFSKTLQSVSSEATALERQFDAEAVRRMKAAAAADLTVGGADLAGQAFDAGLVDEIHLFLWPLVLGGGKQAFPVHTRLDLELLAERRLSSGIVHLHHRVPA